MRRPRVTFIYLGTGHAFARFVTDLARAAKLLTIETAFIIAAHPLSAELDEVGVRKLSVPGIDRLRPFRSIWRLFQTRRALLAFLDVEQPDCVITLMPHVWSPVLAPAIKRRCSTYCTVMHDAVPHPGDRSGWVTRWLLWDGQLADIVITLSASVAKMLFSKQILPSERILTLFHPYLTPESGPANRQFTRDRPLKVLFFGRILAYKGLPLLIEAIEVLRNEGIIVTLGVAGAGDITQQVSRRLAALGAEVINRVISNAEAAELLAKYDAMACPYIEASQSGVAALAFGHCMPVIATPVGGLAEQVVPGRTGVLAANLTSRAIADAIRQLITTPDVYDQISRSLAETQQAKSMDTFLAQLIPAALSVSKRPSRHRPTQMRSIS